MTEQRQELTFKHNLKRGRHGWLRLTPAYSIRVVYDVLERASSASRILDPFGGTGTTGLVCAERGLDCDLIDINPFLIWFMRAKTARYDENQLRAAAAGAETIVKCLEQQTGPADLWVPPISNISRWWSESRLKLLARLYHEIHTQFPAESPARDLLLVIFCRLVIEASNAAFNHQSMSFKDSSQLRLFDDDRNYLTSRFMALAAEVVRCARSAIMGRVRVIQADSREVPDPQNDVYDCVITSPPYPNRMSYIRELRPYMYWLGYLKEARDAGEMDWQAIGGTWGIATSRLQTWQPDGVSVDYPEFESIIERIADESTVLANYVHKYFVDAALHLKSLYPVLDDGAEIFYIVGNSKFYNTLVPTEELYAALMKSAGMEDVSIEILRKRNSKKELYEYLVSARKPRR